MNEREKTGGRQAGTPNKATAIIRQRIGEADPIGFMIQVAKGESIGDSPAPTLAERIKANEWLGRKLTPDAKERQISFKVPKIEKPADALKAIAGVIEALGDGKSHQARLTLFAALWGSISKLMKQMRLMSV